MSMRLAASSRDLSRVRGASVWALAGFRSRYVLVRRLPLLVSSPEDADDCRRKECRAVGDLPPRTYLDLRPIHVSTTSLPVDSFVCSMLRHTTRRNAVGSL